MYDIAHPCYSTQYLIHYNVHTTYGVVSPAQNNKHKHPAPYKPPTPNNRHIFIIRRIYKNTKYIHMVFVYTEVFLQKIFPRNLSLYL